MQYTVCVFGAEFYTIHDCTVVYIVYNPEVGNGFKLR